MPRMPLAARRVFRDASLLLVADWRGTTLAWNLRSEERPPAVIAAVVAERIPWRLEGGRLVPHDR